MKRALIVLVALAPACADSTTATQEPAAAESEQEPIVSVSTRDHVIQFFSAEVVTLRDHGGKVLEARIPIQQFRADYPDLVEYLDNAIAKKNGEPSGLDASVEPEHLDKESAEPREQ